MSSYTYTWANAEQTTLKREDADGNVAWVPVTRQWDGPQNRDYVEFRESGAEAGEYVPPADPQPLTTEEKLKALGLTKAELKAFLK